MKKKLLFLLSILIPSFISGCKGSSKEWTVTFNYNCEIEGKTSSSVKVKDGECVSPLDISDKNPDKTLEFSHWYTIETGPSYKFDFYTKIKSDVNLYAKWDYTSYYKFLNKLKENEEKSTITNGKVINLTYKNQKQEEKTLQYVQIDENDCIDVNGHVFRVRYSPSTFKEVWKNCENVSYATNALCSQIYCDTYLDGEECELDLWVDPNNYVVSIKITKNGSPYFTVDYGSLTYQVAKMYNVTFKYNCEIEGKSESSLKVRENMPVKELDIKDKNPDKKLEFKYWATDPSCEETYKYNFSSPITNDLTLYAKWDTSAYYKFLNKIEEDEKSSTTTYTKVSAIRFSYNGEAEKVLLSQTIDEYKCIQISGAYFEVRYTVKDFQSVWTNCTNFITDIGEDYKRCSCNAITEGMACFVSLTLDNDNYVKAINIVKNNKSYFVVNDGDINYI